MKKIYFLLIFAVFPLMIFGQSTCPNPGGLAFPYKYQGSCYVYVTNTMPNADITVYHNTTNITVGSPKTDASGTGTAFYTCGNTITLILLTKADGSVCQISGSNIAAVTDLPIKLSSFDAHFDGNVVQLTWTSELEQNSYQYQVQKSTDGASFNTIGEVAAKGNSTLASNYSFTDDHASVGAAFYRLKMIDLDGDLLFSKVVYVNSESGTGGAIRIAPNPFQSQVRLMGADPTDVVPANIKIFTGTGGQVSYSISGSNTLTINQELPAGIYILQVKGVCYKLIKL